MRLPLVSLLIGVAALTGGCRNSSPVPDVGPLPTQSFKRQWTAKLPVRDDVAALHLADNTLFVYTRNNVVYALDRGSGHVNYVVKVSDGKFNLRAPVVLADRVIIPTSTAFQIYGPDGRLVQTLDLNLPMRSGAVVSGNNLYVGVDYARGGRILAIDLQKPYSPIRWELMTYGGITSTPALVQNVVYAGSEDGSVYAVTQDRSPLWPTPGNVFRTQGPIRADLKADEFGVYVASTDSKLYCLDRATGKVKWQYFASNPLDTAPVVTGDTIYQYVPRSGVVAIDKITGQSNRQPRWVAADATQWLAQDEKYVYVARKDSTIAALDRQTGQLKFHSRKTDFATFATNLAGPVIYAATKQGQTVAITPVLAPGEVGQLVLNVR